MSTLHARRVRIVGVAAATLAVWIGIAACAKKDAKPSLDASKRADSAVATTSTDQTTLIDRPPTDACFHFDGSEYKCPEDREKDPLRVYPLLASGTVIDSGSITFMTAQGTHTIKFRPNAKVDAIFLTPKGLKVLEDHYRHDRPHKPEHARRADSLAAFIATFKEP